MAIRIVKGRAHKATEKQIQYRGEGATFYVAKEALKAAGHTSAPAELFQIIQIEQPDEYTEARAEVVEFTL